MLDTILFDLDGTLLPMEQDAFIQAYFQAVGARAQALGYAPMPFLSALWEGTESMLRNDGQALNHDRFWDTFAAKLGPQVRELEPVLDRFYLEDFHLVRKVVDPAPRDVRGLLQGLREKGYGIVLATTPLFPPEGIETRLSWIGLKPRDFDWVTTYDNSTSCKPNPAYYQETLARIHRQPQDCLMVGNNPVEDMVAGSLGMSLFLVTDHLENPKGVDISPYPQGSFQDLCRYLDTLPLCSKAG